MGYLVELAYTMGNCTIKVRFSVFLTVLGLKTTTEALEIVHRTPVYLSLDMTEMQCGLT